MKAGLRSRHKTQGVRSCWCGRHPVGAGACKVGKNASIAGAGRGARKRNLPVELAGRGDKREADGGRCGLRRRSERASGADWSAAEHRLGGEQSKASSRWEDEGRSRDGGRGCRVAESGAPRGGETGGRELLQDDGSERRI
ncbi:uncharacterized protein A4U43_C07F20050 [Asparagus officinalis]|uniref:Uncharacterized protein n=1 Tax=Asparagus officinalis TaxID=4686 RepID=A0A5P1EFA2_ASPOF|nr:uncharacterized protein A4U43_C07F20050 [Asparagus officinalis]